MRKYIFTESEREGLKAWLNGGEMDSETRKLFVRVRRNLNSIRREVELLSQVAQRLSREGRLMGRVRLHGDSTSQSRLGESASIQRKSETST